MKQGRFYFISDEFYEKHDKNHELMQNKETVGGKVVGRPCCMVFVDKYNPNIFWCVPISSNTDKYQNEYNKKNTKTN